MRTATVFCPERGAIYVDGRMVIYQEHGDGTATYEFDCEQCAPLGRRHEDIPADLGTLNKLKASGAKSRAWFNREVRRFMREAHGVALLTEDEIALFTARLHSAADDILDELL